MTHKGVLQRLDDAANLTGIPQLAMRKTRRRAMRWLPMIPLAMAVAGWIACMAETGHQMAGQIIVTLGFSLSVWLPLAGPLKPWGSMEDADERERDLRRRAFLVTLAIIALIAVVALVLLPTFALLGQWPIDVLVHRNAVLAFALFAMFNTLPTLYASWAMRPLGDEE